MTDHPEAWHLKELILKAVSERDEDGGYFGMTFDSDSTAEEMAEQIIRVMALNGYDVRPPSCTDRSNHHQSTPGRVSLTIRGAA